MKCTAYFLLLCGLASSPVWGQAAPKNVTSGVRSLALSCRSSEHSVIRTANLEVKLGTFKPFPIAPPAIRTVKLENFKSSLTGRSAIRTAKYEVKLGIFESFPTVHSGVRTVKYEVKLGTFKPFPATPPRVVLWQVSELQKKEEKTETVAEKTNTFPLLAFIVRH